MSDKIETIRKWGYGPDGASKIFDVPADDPTLPDGWHESPADVPDNPNKAKKAKAAPKAKPEAVEADNDDNA